LPIQSFSLLSTIIIYIYGGIVCLICLIPRFRKFYIRAINFNVLKKLRTYFIMLLALLTIFIANLMIFHHTLSSTFDLLTDDYSLTTLLDDRELFQYIIYTVIIAPIMEEMVFRVPISIWMNRLIYFIVALLLSSILFALLHREYPLFGFVLGVVFGMTYKLTKSIVPAIFVHMIWNAFSLFYFNYI